MSEPTVHTDGLDRDLRGYFKVTTSTELPRRVDGMSVGTLTARKKLVTPLRTAAAGVLALVAVVVVVTTHHAAPGGADTAFSSRGGGAAGPAEAGPLATSPPASIRYSGVDTTALAYSGALLLAPAGHGSARLTPGQAQAAAVSALGARAQTPGPAVLAFVELAGGTPGNACLCWVVDVPVRGGVSGSGGAQPSAAAQVPHRSELVLVDALTGRVFAVLSGAGIP